METESTYYIESALFLSFIELPPNDPVSIALDGILADAEKGRFRIVTSAITMPEVFYAKEESDGKVLDPTVQAKIDYLFHPASSPVEIIPVHEIIAREAHQLLRGHLNKGWTKTKGLDAIHLITAKRESVDEFLTTEKAMHKWGEILGFKVVAPHYIAPGNTMDTITPALFDQAANE